MADTKVTALTENTTVAVSDLLYVVDNPGGTPASQKATVANVVAAILPLYACCVSRSSALEIATATPTAITWDNEVRDDGGCWSSGDATKLVAPVAGWYAISSWVWWKANNAGGRRLYILANGTTTVGRSSTASSAAMNDITNHVSAVYYLAASEYVQIMADQNSGGGLDVQAGAMAQMARIH